MYDQEEKERKGKGRWRRERERTSRRGRKGKGDPRTGSYILKGRRDSTAWPVSRLDPPKSGAGARDRPL